MIIPAVVILRGQRWDRRPAATIYGLLIGLTGAGGQLALFQALTMGPAYLIFPIISISPAITVVMAMVLLRERIRAARRRRSRDGARGHRAVHHHRR